MTGNTSLHVFLVAWANCRPVRACVVMQSTAPRWDAHGQRLVQCHWNSSRRAVFWSCPGYLRLLRETKLSCIAPNTVHTTLLTSVRYLRGPSPGLDQTQSLARVTLPYTLAIYFLGHSWFRDYQCNFQHPFLFSTWVNLRVSSPLSPN